MRRSVGFTAKDLLVSEIVVLQRADNPDGIHGWALVDVFTEREARTGALYRRLGILASRGYLSEQLEDDDASQSHRGAARRIYSITEAGQIILQEAYGMMGLEVPVADPNIPTTPDL